MRGGLVGWYASATSAAREEVWLPASGAAILVAALTVTTKPRVGRE